MKYETAAFLSRDGNDDYTFLVQDLPQETVSRFRNSECAIRGSLETLMEQLLIEPGNIHNRVHLLFQKGNTFMLCTSNVPWEFFEKNIDNGCSARGCRDAVLLEAQDFFSAQVHLPKMTI